MAPKTRWTAKQWIKFVVSIVRMFVATIPDRDERTKQLKKAINKALDQILELMASA